MKVGFSDTNVLEGWRWSRRTRINRPRRHGSAPWGSKPNVAGVAAISGKDHLRIFPYRASGLLPIAARIFAAQFGDWRTRC